MSEKQLGKALLDLDAAQLAGVPDMRQQTWRIVQRDGRRVWWLTVVTMVLWAAALTMVLLMLVAFGLLFPLQAKLNQDDQLARLPPEMRQTAKTKAQIVFQMITVGVTASVGILSLAASRPCCSCLPRAAPRCGRSTPACWRSPSSSSNCGRPRRVLLPADRLTYATAARCCGRNSATTLWP